MLSVPEPSSQKVTVYSKSGCPNCTKVKHLLKEKQIDYEIHNCDEYILEDKAEFLKCIQLWAQKECKMFPMVFINGHYVGGFAETERQLGFSVDADF